MTFKGAFVVKPTYPKLNVSIEACFNDSIYANTTTKLNQLINIENNSDGLNKFYSLSYMWYTAFGALITIIFGLIISIATGGLKNKVDKKYIILDLSKFCKSN